MDVQVNVGLGHGSREQQASMLGQLIQMQQTIVAMQGGIAGPLVFGENVYNSIAQFVQKAVGFKAADQFITDPGPKEKQPPQQPQQNPEIIKAQAQIQADQMKAMADIERRKQEAVIQAQLKREEAQNQIVIDRMKAEAQIEIERIKASHDMQIQQQKAQLDVHKTHAELELKRASGVNDIAMKREHHGMQMEATKAKADGHAPKSDGSHDAMAASVAALAGALEKMNAPKKITKSKDGYRSEPA